MNNEIQKDEALSQLYRDIATEEPPAHLDATILAAAKREVNARPQRAGLPFFKRSWQIPVSIAAAFVITISLFPLLKDHSTDSSNSRFDFPHDAVKAPPLPVEKSVDLNDEIHRKEASMLNGGHMPEPTAPSTGSVTTEAQPNQALDATQYLKSNMDQKIPAKAGSEEAITAAQKPQSSGFVADPQPIAQRAKELDSAKLQAGQGPAITLAPPVRVEKFETKTLQKRQSLGATNMATPAASAPASALAETTRENYKSEQRSADTVTKENKDDLVEAKKKEFIMTPQDWIKKIELMAQQNKLAEAKAEITEFRKRYPYYPISPALKQALEIND